MTYIVTVFSNFLLLIIFKNNWIPRVLFLLMLAFLSYSYVDLADYDGYVQMYEGPQGNLSGLEFLEKTEIGFRSLIYISNYLGIKFEIFKLLIYLVFGFILVNSLLSIDRKSTNFVLCMYILYPMILDLVQIRHFMAMSIFLFGFSQILKSISSNSYPIKGFILLFFSTLFHSSFVILIIFVFFALFFIKFIYLKQFFLKTIILLTLSFLVVSFLIVLVNLNGIDYFLTNTSKETIVFYGIIYSFFYIVAFLVKNRINNLHSSKEFSFVFIYITLLVGATFPLLFFNVEFFRFFRVSMIILLSTMFSILVSKHNFINGLYVISIMISYTLLAVAIFYIYYLPNLIIPFYFNGSI